MNIYTHYQRRLHNSYRNQVADTSQCWLFSQTAEKKQKEARTQGMGIRPQKTSTLV